MVGKKTVVTIKKELKVEAKKINKPIGWFRFAKKT